MSILTRIIPRLDIKGNNLVKGVNLEGLRVLGEPEVYAKQYFDDGADEIIYQDVVASLYDRNSLYDVISKTAKQVFIPLTVGGGIRNLKDIFDILRVGADKISINTAAVNNPNFIHEAVKKFGSSTIVVSIEIVKHSDGLFYVFTENGRNNSGIEVFEWIKTVEKMKAGEIALTFVDAEGTGKGIDLEFTKKIKENVSMPVVVHGGFGSKEQVLEAIKNTKVDGIAIASMFHYNLVDKINIENIKEGNLDYLKKKKRNTLTEQISIRDLKKFINNYNKKLIRYEEI